MIKNCSYTRGVFFLWIAAIIVGLRVGGKIIDYVNSSKISIDGGDTSKSDQQWDYDQDFEIKCK